MKTIIFEVKRLKLRNLLIGAGVGFSIGYVLRTQLDCKVKLSPEQALKHAKIKFEEVAPIVGSWIYIKEERIEKNGLFYNTYRGGISRNVDGKTSQYEFFVDTDTGAIVAVDEVTVA